MSQIIVYGKRDCPKCEGIKKLLDKKRIKYETNYDEPELRKKGFTYLPMVDIDGVVFNYTTAAQLIMKMGG